MIEGSIMKHIFKFILIFFCIIGLSSFTSCNSKNRYATEVIKNVNEVTKASQNGDLSSSDAVKVINITTDEAIKKLDPDNKVESTTTAAKIKLNPKEEIEKILKHAYDGPTGFSWGWLATTGVLALGLAGKFLGGHWNVAGTLLQTVASRFIPTFNRDRKAAMALIVATDVALEDWKVLLDSVPETKAALAAKLGGDPTEWLKKRLKAVHTDLGAQEEVSGLITMLKQELTTKDGVLQPIVSELDKIISRKI